MANYDQINDVRVDGQSVVDPTTRIANIDYTTEIVKAATDVFGVGGQDLIDLLKNMKLEKDGE